jgi:glyoxylase-like metal-dependent hydrolase (beta-lactamase superfamily II)
MKRIFVLGTLVALGALSMAVSAFQNPPAGAAGQEGRGRGGEGRGRGPAGPPVLDIVKVKDNLWMITGNGGNTAVFQTANGLVLVDTKNPGGGQLILDKIKTVTNKPITTIINTHTHADHTGGNEFFGTSVEFVAHENTKANMEKMDNFKGDKSVFLPKKTFKDKLTLGSGKDEIDLFYFGPAHTSGDAFVIFKELRVAHVGDTFAGKGTPLIDGNNGGSGVEYGKTMAKAAAGIKNVDWLITGHSTLMTPADLKEFADFNNDFTAWGQAQMKAGKTVDEAAAAYKIPDWFKARGYTIGNPIVTPTGNLGGVKGNLQVIYNELKK